MTGSVSGAQLRAFVERIERIEADIKDLNGDKSEVYKELRGCGFDVKAVRAVVAKRKLDTTDREERDAMFDLYWSALHGTGTEDATRVHVHEASYSEAKGRGDLGKTEGHSYDPETGEHTDNQLQPVPTALTVGVASAAPDDVGATASSTNSNSHRTPARADMVEAATDKQAACLSRPTNSNSPDDLSAEANSAGEAPSSSQASPATLSDDIDLTIPDFLRRTEGGYPKREAVDA